MWTRVGNIFSRVGVVAVDMVYDMTPYRVTLLSLSEPNGSNGSRNKLWKKSLQILSNEKGLAIHVSHFPPGTSKWNKVEHRVFSHISKNWRGRPLVSLAVIISLIGSTITKKGLRVRCGLDTNEYEKSIKVSDEELDGLNISRHEFHGEWNYLVSPSETFA